MIKSKKIRNSLLCLILLIAFVAGFFSGPALRELDLKYLADKRVEWGREGTLRKLILDAGLDSDPDMGRMLTDGKAFTLARAGTTDFTDLIVYIYCEKLPDDVVQILHKYFDKGRPYVKYKATNQIWDMDF